MPCPARSAPKKPGQRTIEPEESHGGSHRTYAHRSARSTCRQRRGDRDDDQPARHRPARSSGSSSPSPCSGTTASARPQLGILAVGYVLTGLGITVGYHRLFTHRSFETYPVVRYTFAVLGQMGVEGDVSHLGGRPPQAPPVLRPRGRSAQPARRLRRGTARAFAALARAHRLDVRRAGRADQQRATRRTSSTTAACA